MTSGGPDGDRPGHYYRVSRFDIRKENEIAVVLVPGEAGPMAVIEDPTLTLGRAVLRVPEALSLALHVASSDVNRRHIVVVDDEGLWELEWGVLVPHPGRS